MTENKESDTPAAAQTDDDEIDKEIDETLEETFPASDPPSWTLGTDHRVESQTDVTEHDDE